MKFSIIIPAYNEEIFLPACLESIKQQSLPADQFEVIVIDNGSTDKTRSIAEGSGATVIVDEQSNVSGLRNLGAKQAAGSVLAFIDADCTASKNWLNSALVYIDDDSVSAWGAPPGVPEDASWVQKSWFNLRKKMEMRISVDWLESMNLFVRKDEFFSIGGFNDSLVTCEDVDFSYRLGEKGQIISDNRIQVIHYGEAKTVRQFIKKEFWRGISNYNGVFSHGIKLSELSSLLFPVYFAFFIPAVLLLAVFFESKFISILAIIALLLPAAGVAFKLLKKKLSLVESMQLQFLIHIYFVVRTVSAFKGLLNQYRK